MGKDIANIVREAKKALEYLENGKSYPSNYVVGRFENVLNKYPNDILVGNMKDVLVKFATKQKIFTQKEITKIYSSMQGLGGQSSFMSELGDLVSNGTKAQEPIKQAVKTRTFEEKNIESVYKESELSNAISTIFGYDKEIKNVYAGDKNKNIEKIVLSQLNSIGLKPDNFKISKGNEHFILCTASYDTNSFNQVSVNIPVQLISGKIQSPNKFIDGQDLTDLNKINLSAYLKIEENKISMSGKNSYAGMRGDGTSLENRSVVTPAELKDFSNLENSIVAAANNHKTEQIIVGINLVASELISVGVNNPIVKLASSDANGMIFDATIATQIGKVVVSVPVEFVNKKALMPSKFAAGDSKTSKIYDLSKKGMSQFFSDITSKNYHETGLNVGTIKIARDNGGFENMTYHQLVDRILDGVSNKDYKLAEDALSEIQIKFSSDKYLAAFDKFNQLLKCSTINKERDELIKAATKRGDLIKTPNSVELYSPKLGLPLSKIDFDSQGRVTPKYRKAQLNNLDEEIVSTSSNKIYLS